jgi:NTE family protein
MDETTTTAYGRPENTTIQSLHGVPRPRRRNATAFVLSGGGARGALQVGALRALMEHGERPDLVVGASVGSWNAAWLAGAPTPDGVEALAELWRSIRPAQVLLGRALPARSPLGALGGLLALSAARRLRRGAPSLCDNAGLRDLLARHLGGRAFEDLMIPLRVVAADLTHGRRAVFSSGPVVPALLASSAIPGIFPPVRIGDAVYADGSTIDSCSLETALGMGARRLFVLAIGHDTLADGGARWSGAAGAAPYSASAVVQRTAQIVGAYHLQRDLERLPPDVEVHVVSLHTGSGGGTLDFGNAEAWIEQGYATMRAYLRAAPPARAAALTA